MPSPKKFQQSLASCGVSPEVIRAIGEGFETIDDASAQAVRAAYFKRAADIMDASLSFEARRDLMDQNGCCKSGARKKASQAFFREHETLTLAEKLPLIAAVPNMGCPALNEDGTITIQAVTYRAGERFACACPNYNRLKRDYPVSRTYCLCCAGHFRYHYEIMLGVKLRLQSVDSSPLDTDGAEPCVMTFTVA
ncbi:MAG: hypothetical protein ABFC31_00390 [Clostridiaceae bacterium]